MIKPSKKFPINTSFIKARFSKAYLAVFAVVFAGIGAYLLFHSHAATPYMAVGASNTVCNKYASPTGNDSNAGSLVSPYRSLSKLDTSLATSQVGCLRAGDYNSGVYTTLTGTNITITGYPGESALIHGGVYQGGSGVILSYINYDSDTSYLNPWPALCQGAISGGAKVTAAVEITGSNDIFEHNNIYVDPSVPLINRGGALGVGFNANPSNVAIRYNRIHDVGFCPVEEHGAYIDNALGVQIYGNWIYNIPAGTGVQVWDHAHGDHIYNNVMENTSSCMDIGSNTNDTINTLAEHNLCVNMFGVQQPYSSYCTNPPGPGCTGPDPGVPLFDYWGGGAGTGNVFQNNLLYCVNGLIHCSTSLSGSSGVSLSGNIVADPQFSDPNYATSHDYRVSSSSPAASWGLWDGDLGSGGGGGGSVPSTPAGLTATPGNAQVVLNWNANSSSDNVTQYNIYRTDTMAAWGNTTATTFTNSDQVVNGTQYCYQITAVNSTGESSKTSQVCATPSATTSCTQGTASWQNNSITNQTGSFSFDFDATPSANNISAVTGLSNGPASAYTNLAVIIAFEPSGVIDAINGGSYGAASTLNYVAGTSYHFKLTVNIPNHSYSVAVTPNGGSPITLATNYTFRTEQASVASLNNWATVDAAGSHTVCNASVAAITKIGDINNDGSVNVFDLSILLSHFGSNYAAADLNNDGTVNIFDLSILLSNYGA